jgi:hypothetical protein
MTVDLFVQQTRGYFDSFATVSSRDSTPRLCNLKNPAHNVETCPRCQRLLRSPEARKNLREKKKSDRRTEKEFDARRNPIRVVQGGLGSGNT